ncbi:endonuclease-reverse transcriptase [Plakobranchus ocellatus]|uniref:Endonuclease-reverse transcriptase n=1 Tax=Plakobranchus ocellatus TaxID=259542 RepID=A0AAV4AB88_9GAST|nr:endonuclease-reverse transcriptase [Plakobranchus ocellatus]
MDFSPTVRQSFPCQQPSGPKIDTHVYPSVMMGGTTLDPKHNVGKRTPTECVDHGRFKSSKRRWSSEASSYANHFDRHSNIGRDTHINPWGKKKVRHVVYTSEIGTEYFMDI